MKHLGIRALAAALTAAMMMQPAAAFAASVEEVPEAAAVETVEAVETAEEIVIETEEEAAEEAAVEAEEVVETEKAAAAVQKQAPAQKTAKAQTMALYAETDAKVIEIDATLSGTLVKPQITPLQLAGLFGDNSLAVAANDYGIAVEGSSDIKVVTVATDIDAGKNYVAYKRTKKLIGTPNAWSAGVPFSVRLYRNSNVTLEVLNGIQPKGATVVINGETVDLLLVGAVVKMYEDESYTIRPNPVKGYKAVLKVDGKEVAYPYTITNPSKVYSIQVGYKEADLAATEVHLKNGVSVAYGTTNEQILSKVFKEVVVAEGAEVAEDAPALNVAAQDCILSVNKGGLAIGENEVTVTYPGDGKYYDASSATVTINVTKAKATVKVANNVVKYGEKADIAVTTSPAGLDYITVIGGMDAYVSGFVSIDVPESTKNTMRIKDPITGAVLFDAYDKLCELIGDGVSAKEFTSIIGQINDMVKGNPIIDAAAGIAGFDITTLEQVVDILTKLPSMDVTITLGNTPKNAGLYLVGAVVTDSHYQTAVGFGSYTVMRKSVITSSNISLGFINELPGKSMTAAEAAKFDFSACVFDDGEIVVPEKGLSVTYTGLTSKGRIYSSKNAPTEAGSYVQTVALTLGNYRAFPKSRTIKITK